MRDVADVGQGVAKVKDLLGAAAQPALTDDVERFLPVRQAVFLRSEVKDIVRAALRQPQEAVPPAIQRAFVTLETNSGACSIVMKFNQREDAYEAHSFLLGVGGKDWRYAAPTSKADAEDAASDAQAYPDPFAVWKGWGIEWQFGQPESDCCLYTTQQLIDHAVASVRADRAALAAQQAGEVKP